MEQGTIEVTASHSPLAFIYSLFKVNIEIDGDLVKRPWATYLFGVPTGRHTVAVSYRWLFVSQCGRNSVDVEVHPGETVRVHYRAGLIRFLPGKMSVRGQ